MDAHRCARIADLPPAPGSSEGLGAEARTWLLRETARKVFKL
jgi:hypothetical protein